MQEYRWYSGVASKLCLRSVAGIVECSEIMENPNRLQLALMLNRRFPEVVKNM
jgi:hypothetical protein